MIGLAALIVAAANEPIIAPATGPNVVCEAPEGQGLYLGQTKPTWENDGIIIDGVKVDLRNPDYPIVSLGLDGTSDIRLSGATVKVRVSDTQPKTYFVDAFYYSQGRTETYALVDNGASGWLFMTSINSKSAIGKPSIGAFIAKCRPN